MNAQTNASRAASTITWELGFKRSALADAQATLARAPYWQVDECTRIVTFIANSVATLETELASL